MAEPRLRVLILGGDAAQRGLLRAALASPDGGVPSQLVRITVAGSAREIVPGPRRTFDAALLCLAPGEDGARAAREASERLPHVPLVAVSFLRRGISTCRQDSAPKARRASTASGRGKPRPFGGGLSALSSELCKDARELVACGIEDHVAERCLQCSSPRARDAIRWAIERRKLLEQVERLRRQSEEMALHDPLTGLANRHLLHDRLRHLLARNARSRQGFALLFVDLDGFKSINDELGHAAGDELLAETARRLSNRVRAGDTVARWGGDEFLVLLEELDRSAAAVRVATDLLAAVSAPVRIDGRQVRVRASIGISRYPADGKDADALIRAADEAMYAAKAAGGGAIQRARGKVPRRRRR